MEDCEGGVPLHVKSMQMQEYVCMPLHLPLKHEKYPDFKGFPGTKN